MTNCANNNHICIVLGHGPLPELPSFQTLRTYSYDLLTAIEEYAEQRQQTLFYIHPGPDVSFADIQAAILAGFPVCIRVSPTIMSHNADFITFSHSIMLYDIFKAVIYADSREEIFEPPSSFLKDRIVLPAVLYFEMRGAIDPPANAHPFTI
jgi:hypothetical protein